MDRKGGKMNKNGDCGTAMAIFLASLVLIGMTAKAETLEPKKETERLIWTSDCPAGVQTNTNMCRKKIYADDSIDISKLKWEQVEDIAKLAYDWKYRLKERFGHKKK